MAALNPDAFGVAGVDPACDAVDEAAVCVQVLEVAGAAQVQGVIDGGFEMAVGAFDGAVFMGDAPVVAGGIHAVVFAKAMVFGGGIVAGGPREVLEGGREAVGPVLPGGAADGMEGVLQPFGERGEAFAAQHDMDVGEAGERQPEVAEHVIQLPAGNVDAQIAHAGEVRDAHPAGRVVLQEDDLLLGAVLGLPFAHPPLQGALDARLQFGMEAHHFLVDGHGPDAGAGLKYLLHFVDDIRKRVSSPPAAPRLRLRERVGLRIEPVAGRAAEAGLGGGHRDGVFSPVHGEIFLLLVVHMAAWHERFSFWKTA